MATIIKSGDKYVFIADCVKTSMGWQKIVDWSTNKSDAIIFTTGILAESFIVEHNLDAQIVTIDTPKIHDFCISNSTGEMMGIYNKKTVYFISGNIGMEDQEGWYSTDEGFVSLDDCVVLTQNDNLLEIAKQHGAFLDDNEWFFSNKKSVRKFYSYLKTELVNKGIDC